jgi:hypothetical protein
MSNENDNPQVNVKPEEDARLPILEARIEREWSLYRPKYLKSLKDKGTLEKEIHQTALMCIETLHQFQNKGLGADQRHEAIRAFIHPECDRS